MSVCRKVGSQSGDEIHEIFSNCTECGHTRGVHPGAMNKGLTACVICELLTPPTCQRPPKDWEPCRRMPGHAGTCSPYPDVPAGLLELPGEVLIYGWDGDREMVEAAVEAFRIKRNPPDRSWLREYETDHHILRDFLTALRKLWQPEILILSVGLTAYGFCFYWACTR